MDAVLSDGLLAAVFTVPDYVVLAAYMVGVVVLGSWVGRGASSTTDYLLADRKMNWAIVAVSIIATDLSAVTYMGVPGWLYRHDLKYNVGNLFTPLVMLLVVVLFARVYHRLRVFTVYEYLEYRFHPVARTVIAVLFLFQRGVWLAGVIYIPSLAMQTTTGLPLMGCILAIGLLTTLYTFVGGMKAVIWTDFMQFVVLVGGLVVMLGIVLAGLNWDIVGLWQRAGAMTAADSRTPHTEMVTWTFDLKTEATIWVLFVHYLVYQMGTYGADQVVAQRYFTMDSFRSVAKSVIGSGFLTVIVVSMLSLLGLGFVVYYDAHPALASTLEKPDQIMPHFVVHVLPLGVRGLIVAAILAATMSSVSSGLNSFAAVAVMDLYKRHFRSAATVGGEPRLLMAAKLVTLVSGLLGTAAAVWISTRQTAIVETVAGLASKFIGPITGIYLMGALTKRANVAGVLVGAVAGLTVAGLMEWAPVKENVNWMWTAPLTCLATLVFGYGASLALPGAGTRFWVPRQETRGFEVAAERRN
jgi:SSS family transporter